MNKMDILGFIGAFIVMTSIAGYMFYQAANNVCLKSESIYVREQPAGLFGVPVQIETTQQNADGVGQKCVKYYNANLFDIFTNSELSITYYSGGDISKYIK